MTFELPWPPAALSPNASHQGNWWGRRKAAADYREACAATLATQCVPKLYVDPPVMLSLFFCAPTKRLTDLDNLLARAKHGIDALAERMGVDDKHFEYTLRRGETAKGGKLLIKIGGDA